MSAPLFGSVNTNPLNESPSEKEGKLSLAD